MTGNAIITGASGGIGGAVAEKLASEGYTLALLGSRSPDTLKKTAGRCGKYGGQVHALPGDIRSCQTTSELMSGAVRLLGHIDLLVNCAGISHIGLVTELSDEEWHNMIESNLSSVFYCCRAAAAQMVRQKSGRILNISSVWGNTGASCEVAYSASKGGVNAFTKALAKELAPSGIAVNAIAFGAIDTAMNECFTEEERNALCREIPAGRMGSPDEAAGLTALLAKAPYYLTGQIITMDGGWT